MDSGNDASASDPDLLGRRDPHQPGTMDGRRNPPPRNSVSLNGEALTNPDIFLPVSLDPATADRGTYYLRVLGRLRDG